MPVVRPEGITDSNRIDLPELPFAMSLNSAYLVIVAEGLGKRLGDVVAVDYLSGQILSGETVASLGGKGTGKTTTMSMLLGLLTLTVYGSLYGVRGGSYES